MRRVLVLLVIGLSLSACGPAHLRTLGLGGDRDVGELFLGGWDGRRLRVFNDTVIEPGLTTRQELVAALSNLDDDRFTAMWVLGAKLDETLTKHDAFCDTKLCVLVFANRGGSNLATWGPVVAVFELTGEQSHLVGSAWLAGEAIRPPGPERWPLRCLAEDAKPTSVHADGGSIFPHRIGEAMGTKFAIFNRQKVPEVYRQAALLAGFQAPNELTCDHDQARLGALPEPPKPVIEIDPALLEKPAP